MLNRETGVGHLFVLLGLIVSLIFGFYIFRNQFQILVSAQTSSPPVFRASSVNGSGATKVTTLSVNKPSGVVDGDILITQVLTYTTSANVTAPSGWRLINKNVSGTGNGQVASSLYWRRAAFEPSSYTWNFDAQSYVGLVIVGYYNALDLTSPYEFNYGTQNSTQVTAQGVTTSADNEMLVYFGALNGSGVIGNPTGMTQRIGGSTGPEVSEQVITTAGATGSRTGTASSSGNNVGQLLAIKAFPDPSPTPTLAPPLQITFRDKNTSIIGNATSVTVNKPSLLQNGDLMLAQIVVFNNPSATVTPPSNWTLIRSTANGNYRSILYWKKATSSEPSSYVWNFSVSSIAGGGIVAYDNAASPVGSAPFDSNYGTQSSTQVTSSGVPTYASNEMLVYFGMIAAATTITAPSGMTERYGGNFEASDQIISSITTGTGSKTGVAGTTGGNVGQLVALIPEGSAQPPMHSGDLTETATTAGCGVSDSNCTEHVFDVDCQDIPTRQMTIREYSNTTSPKAGAVIFTTGVEGYLLYSDLDATSLSGWNEDYDIPEQTREEVQNSGFKAYELAWTDSNQTGFKTNTDTSGSGFRKAMCGYAAAVKWVYENEGGSASQALCAQGNSAGGTQIAYGLGYYGLGDYLDMTIITGGPPMTRIETGYGSGTCNDSLNYATRFEDYLMGWKNNGDYAAKDCGDTGFTRSPMPASAVQILATQGIMPNPSDPSLASYQGVYSYPHTRVNFVQGQTDPVGTSAQNYVTQVISQNSNPNPGAVQQYTTTYPSIPGGGDYAHLVDQYGEGAGIIRGLIQDECHNW